MHSDRWLFLVTPHGLEGSKQTSITRGLPLTPSRPFQFPPLFQAFIFFSWYFFPLLFSFRRARSSHRLWLGLHGGLRLIAGELKEAGGLHQPGITSLSPRSPTRTSPSGIAAVRAFISPLPDGDVFCSPWAARHLSRYLDQAPRWKITFWAQTLITLRGPYTTSGRLVILAPRDANLDAVVFPVISCEPPSPDKRLCIAASRLRRRPCCKE